MLCYRSVNVLNKHCDKQMHNCKECKYLIFIDGKIRCDTTDYFAQHNIMSYLDKKNERHILVLTDKEKVAVRNLYKYCSKIEHCDNCKRYNKTFIRNGFDIFDSCGVLRVLYERKVRARAKRAQKEDERNK